MGNQIKRVKLDNYYRFANGNCIACLKNKFPDSSTQSTNCYIFASQGHALIIDPGIDNDDMNERLLGVLLELNVDPQNVSFFCTHLHVDHADYCISLVRFGATIRVFDKGKDFLNEVLSPTYAQRATARYIYEGIPELDAPHIIRTHIGSMSKFVESDLVWLSDGDTFKVGTFEFEVVDTRGHTPGCASLYEHNTHLLACGDFLLEHCTPVTSMPVFCNPLRRYFDSFKNLDKLNISYVLPGHGDCAFGYDFVRSKEIEGRRVRLLSTLKKVAKAGREGTIGFRAMSSFCQSPMLDPYDIKEDRSRWGSTSNSISYLEFLTTEGLISRTERNGKALYTITDAGTSVLRENAV